MALSGTRHGFPGSKEAEKITYLVGTGFDQYDEPDFEDFD